MQRCDCDPLADAGQREFFTGTAAAVAAVGVAATAGLAAAPAKAAAIAVDKRIFTQEATHLAIEVGREGLGWTVPCCDRQGRRNHRAWPEPRAADGMSRVPR